MYPLVEAWRSGEQSKSRFCQEHHINIHTFNYWHQKYKLDSDEAREVGRQEFIPLEVGRQGGEVWGHPLELRYPNGVRLCFDGLVDVQYLTTLIQIKV